MKLKYELFLGGPIMFWIALGLIIALIFAFIAAYIIDPITYLYMRREMADSESIQKISEEYVKSLGITISKPIEYRFVHFTENDKSYENKDKKEILLGTFHEWNGIYFIDISVDIYKDYPELNRVVIHETRHMIVRELLTKKIINLQKYTEEIADSENEYYDKLFDSGVYLLRKKQEH